MDLVGDQRYSPAADEAASPIAEGQIVFPIRTADGPEGSREIAGSRTLVGLRNSDWSASEASNLFRHVGGDNAFFYRTVMDVFAAAARTYRIQLRPDDVLAEGRWSNAPPRIEEIHAGLNQLAEWGNLERHHDSARVATIGDFYRAKFLYGLTKGGEAAEAALTVFEQTFYRKAELQTVALEDITKSLESLRLLLKESDPDISKARLVLQSMMRALKDLAQNAQEFMADFGRDIGLLQGNAEMIIAHKNSLLGYLDRFIGDLVSRSAGIAEHIAALDSTIAPVLLQAAERESRDAAPGDDSAVEVLARLENAWLEQWKGLKGWFVGIGHSPSQAELLRSRASAAIPQLLGAVTALNDRRAGRSDRSADFRTLAVWFADCEDDSGAHRLARAAFALNPARHFVIDEDPPAVLPSEPWSKAKSIHVLPRLREYGEAVPRGALARVADLSKSRELLERLAGDEHDQMEAARARLVSGPARLSELGELGVLEFKFFLAVLGEALATQSNPDETVERFTNDGLHHIKLEPLGPKTRARIHTGIGTFSGRDHILTLTAVDSG
jgi:uncharacterized protein (TIGR02677 family)